MQVAVDVKFPGGKKVDGIMNGFTVHTDQRIENGGQGSAPQPFDLFFVSLATCAGIFALEFCMSRNLDTQGLGVQLLGIKNEQLKIFDTIEIALSLPQNFPEKYRDAIIRAVDLCTVKKHVMADLHFKVAIRE